MKLFWEEKMQRKVGGRLRDKGPQFGGSDGSDGGGGRAQN